MSDFMDEEDEAEGRLAFHRDESSAACPYRGSRRREAWLKGWFNARDAHAASRPEETADERVTIER